VLKKAQQPRAPLRSASWAAFSRFPALTTTVGIVIAWQLIISTFGIPDYIAPSPLQVGLEFIRDWKIVGQNLVPTLLEGLGGYLFGNVAAICVAVGMVRHPPVQPYFYPIAVFIQAVPMVAIAPILVLVFGTGYTPKAIISALICFFPTLVNMIRGLKAINPQALELMRILSASEMEVFNKLRVPSSLPFLFAALKVTAPSAIIGAIVGEWIGSNYGLGALILEATFNFRSPLLYVSVITSTAVAMALFSLVGWVETKVIRWKPGDIH
jgi:NitT/TauT family transport system permease protein